MQTCHTKKKNEAYLCLQHRREERKKKFIKEEKKHICNRRYRTTTSEVSKWNVEILQKTH